MTAPGENWVTVDTRSRASIRALREVGFESVATLVPG